MSGARSSTRGGIASLLELLVMQTGRMWLIEGQDRITEIFYFFEFTAKCFGSKHNDMEFALGEGAARVSESIWNKQLSKEDVMRIARKVQPEIQSHTQHLRIALAFFKAGLFADAISEFYEAIVQDPESAMEFYPQMATALRSIGQYEKAVETLNRAMEIADEGLRKDSCDPSDLFVTEQLAAAYGVNGLFNEAFSLYENGDTEKGRNEEHFRLAQMMQVSGSYEQARACTKRTSRRILIPAIGTVALLQRLEIASQFTYWLGDLFCFELDDARTATNI
ncbi:hypothetical protein DL770_000154 [Monosporascus sp. CRB-9-2]|nr:hypothetical protein DL770_000154 [Monosporascus sp. CRB-9-2]